MKGVEREKLIQLLRMREAKKLPNLRQLLSPSTVEERGTPRTEVPPIWKEAGLSDSTMASSLGNQLNVWMVILLPMKWLRCSSL